MADDARQKAEDHYYAALDLVAEGEQERALAEYQQSLAADPAFTEAMHGMARTLRTSIAWMKPSRWQSESPNSIPTTCWPTPACPSSTRKRA